MIYIYHDSNSVVEFRMTTLRGTNKWAVLSAIFYTLTASWAGWETIKHTTTSLSYFDQALDKDNLQNKGAQFLARFDDQHAVLGTILSPTVKQALALPSLEESTHQLDSVIPHLKQMAKKEAALAGRWSWFLLSLSFVYTALAIATYRIWVTRNTVFALALISAVFFIIGISAPAMVIWTSPSIPILTAKLEFVLQHQVRSISSVIQGLFTSGHWIIGALIMLFSIVTPIIKSILTFVSIGTESPALRARVSQALHTIGKWSMADVFVAGVLLALFSLKSQEATRTIPSLGLYYFIGYCLLSMVATSFLVHGEFVEAGNNQAKEKRLTTRMLVALWGATLIAIAIAGAFVDEIQGSDIPSKTSTEAPKTTS